MHRYLLNAGVLCTALWLTPTLAADSPTPTITIISPNNGAKLDAMAQSTMRYEVAPGNKGDHIHVYVDGKEAGILRQLKGSHTFETLAPGMREICVKIVNKAHTPIGIEKCIKVHVE